MNKETFAIRKLRSSFKRVKTYYSDRLDNAPALKYSALGLDIIDEREGQEGFDKIGLTALILLSEALSQFYPNINAPNVLEEHATNVSQALIQHGEEFSLDIQEAIDSIKGLGLNLEAIHELALEIIAGAELPKVEKTPDTDFTNPIYFDPSTAEDFPKEAGTYKVVADGVIGLHNLKESDILVIGFDEAGQTVEVIRKDIFDEEGNPIPLLLEAPDTEGAEDPKTETVVEKKEGDIILPLPTENDPPKNPIAKDMDEAIELSKEGEGAEEANTTENVTVGEEVPPVKEPETPEVTEKPEEPKPTTKKKRSSKKSDADTIADEVIDEATKEADKIADEESGE